MHVFGSEQPAFTDSPAWQNFYSSFVARLVVVFLNGNISKSDFSWRVAQQVGVKN